MADRESKTETKPVERDRYTEPRERDNPDHKDAGQLYVERRRAEEAETAEEK